MRDIYSPWRKNMEFVYYRENVFIFEDNTIQPFTTIGNNTIMWSGNHLGHHSTIGNHCFISSHVVISGACKLGNNIFIGVNSTLHDCVSLGDECLVGGGCCAMSTKPKSVYVVKSTPIFPKTSDRMRI